MGAINHAGQVVGLFNDANDGNDRAFYWTAANGMVELPTLTGIESGARAINNAGHHAGDRRRRNRRGSRCRLEPHTQPADTRGTDRRPWRQLSRSWSRAAVSSPVKPTG